MRPSIGKMRHLVRFGSVHRVQDGIGGAIRQDATAVECYAEILPATVSEQYQYLKLSHTVTHTVNCRYDEAIKPGQIMYFDNNSYIVIGVTNPDMRKRFMKIAVREGGNVNGL